MSKTIYKTIGVPTTSDMKVLLQIACNTCRKPKPDRAEHVLKELVKLLSASCAVKWVIDGRGKVIKSFIQGNRSTPHAISDDVAAELMARTTRKKMPLVRSRSQLINRSTWSRASADWMKEIGECIYSLQKMDGGYRSLIAIYGTGEHNPQWSNRAVQLTWLLHNQTSQYFCTDQKVLATTI